MKKVSDLTLCSILLCILFVQEQLLTWIPNVQFTGFLIVLYSKVIGFKKTFLIVLCHTLLDNLVMGTFLPTVVPFMFLGWFFIPLCLCSFLKRVEDPYKLAFFSFIQGFVYSWLLIPSGLLMTSLDFKAYLIQDIPFEIILATSNALAVLWLYKPLSKVLRENLKKHEL